MPGYPCCCVVATACLETDNFDSRSTLNSPAGSWCTTGSGGCTSPSTSLHYIDTTLGRLVNKASTANLESVIYHLPASNHNNQWDVSAKLQVHNNSAGAALAGSIPVGGGFFGGYGTQGAGISRGRTVGTFSTSHSDSSTSYFYFAGRFTPFTFSLNSDVTVRMTQCACTGNMEKAAFAMGYANGTKMMMGYGIYIDSSKIGLGSGNAVFGGDIDNGSVTRSGSVDDYSIQYLGSGCASCDNIQYYPPFPGSSVTVRFGGAVDCTMGFPSSYTTLWSNLNGSFTLSEVSSTGEPFSCSTVSDSYRFNKRWEYSGTILTYGSGTFTPCSSNPAVGAGQRTVNKVRLSTWTLKASPENNALIFVTVLDSLGDVIFEYKLQDVGMNSMLVNSTIYGGLVGSSSFYEHFTLGSCRSNFFATTPCCIGTLPTGCEIQGLRAGS